LGKPISSTAISLRLEDPA
jgi:hypothetical protein